MVQYYFHVINNNFLPQIFNRYKGKDMSKHKRNLVIAGGVTLSVIVSPVVAAVTVGKLVMFFSLPLFHHQFLTYNVILCLFVFLVVYHFK